MALWKGASHSFPQDTRKYRHGIESSNKNSFECNDDLPRGQLTVRELGKLTAVLRTFDRKDVTLIHEILKVVFKKIG